MDTHGKSLISVELVEPFPLYPDMNVKLITTGNILKLTIEKYDTVSPLKNYTRLNSNEYLDRNTGEIKPYQKGISSSKKSTIKNRNRAFSRLRDIINTNFTGLRNELHIILTYGQKMTDRSQLTIDFQLFWKKMRYFQSKSDNSLMNLQYIAVYEPTQKGVWHIHLLIKDTGNDHLYFKSSVIREMWGHGFIKIVPLSGRNDIGLYFMNLIGYNKGNCKKEELWELYETNKKIYSKSKGITPVPAPEYLLYKDAKERIKNGKLIFDKSKALKNGDHEIRRYRDMQYLVKKVKENY